MSLNEEQVKTWVRQEVRRVIDTGLFYTTEVDKQATQPNTTELPFNPDLCVWEPKDGASGPYEGCKEGPNFTLLRNYLDEHQGKATINGLWYWLFTNKDQIGRKPRKNGGN